MSRSLWHGSGTDVQSIQLLGPFRVEGGRGHVVVALTTGSPSWWFGDGHGPTVWVNATAQSAAENQAVTAEPVSAISSDGLRTDTLMFATEGLDFEVGGDLMFVVEVVRLGLRFTTTVSESSNASDGTWLVERLTER